MPAIFLRGAMYQGSLVDCFATWLAMVGGLRSGTCLGSWRGASRGEVWSVVHTDGDVFKLPRGIGCGGVRRSAEKSVVA